MTNNKPLKHFVNIMLQGLFWLLPIVGIMIILSWLFHKIEDLIGGAFRIIGFSPEHYIFIWEMLAILIFLMTLYVLGWLVKTRLAQLFELIFCKIPGYSTIKGLVGIFNSSKKGQHQVLVVAVKGFGSEGYNIGLMYSQKESIIKDHYTVTLSMSPIPNGGFMFEVHKTKILVIENASFDNNLQYLLSMGTNSLADILKTEPKELNALPTLEQWLASNAIRGNSMKLNTTLLSTCITLLLLTGCGPTSSLTYKNEQLSIQRSDQNLQLHGTQLKQNRENFSTLFLRQSLLRLDDGSMVMYEDARTDLQYQFDPTTTRLISVVFDAKSVSRVYTNAFLYAYQLLLQNDRVLNVIVSQGYDQEMQMVYGMSTKKLDSMLRKLDDNAQPAHYKNVIDLSREPNPLISRWTTSKVHLYPLVIPLRRFGGR